MKENRAWKVGIYTFYTILSVLAIVPLLLVIFISISAEADIIDYGFSFIPRHIDFAAYKTLFSEGAGLVWTIVWTLIVAILGPIPPIIVQVCFAYALAQKKFKWRKPLNYLLIGTMFISGGMVPTYIIYTRLYGLGNNPLIYFLPSVTVWGVALYRTHFMSLPQELMEAARMEGASEVQNLWHIVIPLSKALLGVQYFTSAVNEWNNFTTSLIYMNSNKQFQTLGHYIDSILKDSELLVTALMQAGFSVDDIPLTTLRYAMAVVSMVPVFLFFPFVQKFFTKGIAVGSVKG